MGLLPLKWSFMESPERYQLKVVFFLIFYQVVQKLSGEKPEGKAFRMSPSSSAGDLLNTALSNFNMDLSHRNNFCLLEINKTNGGKPLMKLRPTFALALKSIFIL